jgi:hypothetical protein
MKSARVLGALLLLTTTLLAIVIATDVENGWFGVADETGLAAAAPRSAISQAGKGYGSDNRCLTEDELRRIVREELAAYPAAINVARAQNNPGGDARGPGAPPGSKEFERIDQQVDEYIRAGAISNAEMAALQEELGRLDPAARRQLLGKIVRAMNSGALKGNL